MTSQTSPDNALARLSVDFIPVAAELDAVLGHAPAIPPAVLARWRRPGAFQVRTLIVARRGNEAVGAAFEVHRPLTAYRKIVDVLVADEQVEETLLEAIEQRAWREGAVAVKREFSDQGDAWKRSLARGYLEMPVPAWAAPVTADRAEPVYGQVLRRHAAPARELPYMRQTTDFTCGPVALQMALCGLGLQDSPSREEEVALWRRATTVGGCDPLGLALAAADRGAQVEVRMSTDDACLLELCENDEQRDLRRFIQRGFRTEANARGLDLRHETFDIDVVRHAVLGGAIALLLIDELGMHVDSCPHWITLHSVEGETMIANDPWTDAHLGESHVDALDLPIPQASLDRLAWYGSPPYRAVILLRDPLDQSDGVDTSVSSRVALDPTR